MRKEHIYIYVLLTPALGLQSFSFGSDPVLNKTPKYAFKIIFDNHNKGTYHFDDVS
jgi:hypothetical protein